jgi:hypothetical protein
MSDDYGTIVPEAIGIQTVHHGDPNSTAPHPDTIREILRAKVLDKTADLVDRQSAAEVLRLSFNERVAIPDSSAALRSAA